MTGAVRIAVALAVAVAMVVVVYVRDDQNGGAPARVSEPPAVPAPDIEPSVATRPAVPVERSSSTIGAELQAMSETFRNTTFLIAIRDAGFVCEDVVEARLSGTDSAAWRARCRDLRAYLLGIDSAGALHVEPTADYWDGLYPPRIEPNDGGVRPDRTTPFDLQR
jgi:hypothetical protein